MHKVLIVSDWQIPRHDTKALGAVLKFAKAWQPAEIIYNGDILDFPQLTTKYERRRLVENDIRDDIREFLVWDASFRAACPRAKRVFLPGNHEARLEKLVLERADGLEGLLAAELSLPNLLASPGLEVRGNYLAGTAYWERGGLIVTHGDVTDLALMARDWGSVVLGHTHREAVYTYSSRAGMSRIPHKAISTGALCNIGADAPPGSRKTEMKNWTQGFAVAWFDRAGYQAVPITIVEGRFIGPDGVRYG